ncbi:hypothetical protein KL86DES1_21269 [uncultured Desulfovibrio sp.]|uniref:Uncharacterized protein n=1 Tax=uncultured Desulfovibrio sp. TaxID=167968 RepID=A0A212L7T5_9BACT|nr:hypothetical protein KL86DES1_21269 [uncultured Desulfovibrio sp.]VZH34165.1 conserved protein of unknown function [Desulfovibrio sp. 86]
MVKPQAWSTGSAALLRVPFAALKTQSIATCYDIFSTALPWFAAAHLLTDMPPALTLAPCLLSLPTWRLLLA